MSVALSLVPSPTTAPLRVWVSEHAVLRYAERVMGQDPEGIFRHNPTYRLIRNIVAGLVPYYPQLGAYVIVRHGFRFVVVNRTVVTVTSKSHGRRPVVRDRHAILERNAREVTAQNYWMDEP